MGMGLDMGLAVLHPIETQCQQGNQWNGGWFGGRAGGWVRGQVAVIVSACRPTAAGGQAGPIVGTHVARAGNYAQAASSIAPQAGS